MWITEGGRGWALVRGGPIEVDADDREDDDGGTRTRDFERVVIVAAESGNNEDRKSVHAKSSTSDARVTCTLSRRHQRQQTAVVQGWESEKSRPANQQAPGGRNLLVGMF